MPRPHTLEAVLGTPGTRLYHYTTRGAALEHILNAGSLRVSSFSGMNDPREAMDWRINPVGAPGRSPDDVRRLKADFNAAVKRRSKVVCFTKDVEGGADPILDRGWAHPRMWAQYAENHAGVCLFFDRTAVSARIASALEPHGEIFSGDVVYANDPPELVPGVGLPFDVDIGAIETLSLDVAVSQHLQHHSQALFRTKLSDWQDEHEFRFIVFTQDEEPIYVPIAGTLVAVAMGWQFHEVYEPSLTTLCGRSQVPVLRCSWDNGSPMIDLSQPT